jgi:archaellum component FlaC
VSKPVEVIEDDLQNLMRQVEEAKKILQKSEDKIAALQDSVREMQQSHKKLKRKIMMRRYRLSVYAN